MSVHLDICLRASLLQFAVDDEDVLLGSHFLLHCIEIEFNALNHRF